MTYDIQARALEVVYEGHVDGEIILEQLRKRTYGLYKAFVKWHKEPVNHTHVALILRDKPKLRIAQPRDENVVSPHKHYFRVYNKIPVNTLPEGVPPASYVESFVPPIYPHLVTALGSGNGKLMKKFTNYIAYLTDGHDNGFFEDTWNYKWDHEYCFETTLHDKVFCLYRRGMTVKEAIKSLSPKDQGRACAKYDQIRKMCTTWKGLMHSSTSQYSLDSFTEEARDAVAQWNPKEQSLVLQGTADSGKTEFAKALMSSLTKEAVFITDKEALAFRDTGEGIVYDDMNFSECSRTNRIKFLDVKNDRHIRILYGIHTIEAGCPRIFTTNEDMEDFMPIGLDLALSRRVKIINIDHLGTLYKSN